MRTAVIESRVLTEQPTVIQRGTMTPAEMPVWFPKAYGEIVEFLRTHHTTPTGHPFARYHQLPGGRFEVEAGFPVAAAVDSDAVNQMSSLPGGMVAVTVHVGPYDKLGDSYAAVAEWLRLRGGTPAGDPWEIYHDPPTGDPDTWRTEIVQPYEQGR
jgi:effector-binding domain-containing protein